MRKLSQFCGLFFVLSTSAIGQQQPSVAQDAAAFGALESANSVDLSPDGKSIVYIEPAAGRTQVALVANLATGQSTAFLRSGRDSDRLGWCKFLTDQRLICRYYSVGKIRGDFVGFSRLVAVNREGGQLKELGQSRSFYDAALRQFDGSIVDWSPQGDNNVLMLRDYIPEAGNSETRLVRKKEGVGVDRLNTLTLAATPIEQPRRDAGSYMSDGYGNVRILSVTEYDSVGYPTDRTKYYYRTANSRDWRLLTDYVSDKEFVPLAVDRTANALYALKPLNGRKALYRIKLADSPETELVGSNPRVDIDDLLMSSNGRDVIGYTFAEERRDTVIFDPKFEASYDAVGHALKDMAIVDFRDASADGNTILIYAGSDRDPGRYYVFDRAAKRLNEVMLVRPELENHPLAEVKGVSVRAPDGTNIPAYLTLPVGKTAKNLPGVVLPHGGPSARDEWGFDWLAQFLAARGYAVLQPNFRGSAGFGDAWLVENGFKGWKTSIGDILASGHWLADQGIADPKRLAVVGWSYGGYAALQSAVTEPGLFKGVVAIAPVTDLALVKREAEDFVTSEIVAKFVGSGPHIEEGSPLRHAAAIHVPVLLVHGDRDQNVGIDQSVQMAAALKSNGTPVEFLRFEGLDHQLLDGAARTTMLERIDALLESTIGK